MSSKKTISKETKSTEPKQFLFNKENYYLIGLSLAIVIIGFYLMAGSEGDIYDFRRITLAPIVVITGFLLGIVAIFYRKK
jgi:hypothetical protein